MMKQEIAVRKVKKEKMGIQMIGIDHSIAEIDVRTIFSFTKTKIVEALEVLKNIEEIQGCVLLSTCNRMELWVSCSEEFHHSLYEILCRIRRVNPDPYRGYLVCRKDREAVEHLFALASGLKSRILGEDQILTQVKDALLLAREHYATDNVLETLFRMAVTGGKKVKTEVAIPRAGRSAIHQAMETLKQKGCTFEGKTCMVIGNGEMGKLAATVMTQAGARVTVTVRQYRSGMVEIPRGCQRIDYGNRMQLFGDCDYVVSATASPNYTLKAEAVGRVEIHHPMILIDLAVPRDIDPEIGKLFGITLYDIDDFRADEEDDQVKKSLDQAYHILKEKMEEFYQWYECRDMIPKIEGIKSSAVEDLDLRIQKVMRSLPMEEEQRAKLQEHIDQAVSKVVNKMMFGLRDSVSKQAFRECIEGLEKLYES